MKSTPKKIIKVLLAVTICLSVLYYTAKFFAIYGAISGVYSVAVPLSDMYCQCQNELNTLRQGSPRQCESIAAPSEKEILTEAAWQTFVTFP